MSSAKKTMKGKCQITDDEATDFMDQSQYKKDSPKEKKAQKRLPNDQFEEEDISRLIGRYKATAIKKKKNVIEEQSTNESRVKILEFVGHQLEERKQCSEQLLKALTEIIAESEAEYKIMKENEEKFEHLSVTAMKCIQQSTAVRQQKLRAIKELHASYKNRVEGLLVRGAMKPDDRPIWFDVYRSFPPLTEPKFARPKPEIKPIRQIFYHEDVVRAKFHSQGHGLGAVNMLGQGNDTQTKRLVSQYEKLKAEGVPEAELIEKSVAAVGLERKEQYEATNAARAAKATTPQPGSVTAQIFSESEMKNIFKE